MLDITDPKLYQNFFSIEIQLALVVIVVLFCSLTVLRFCKMDILRASQQKQRFYNYDTDLHSPTLKFLQTVSLLATDPAAILPETPPPSLHESSSSERTSPSESTQSLQSSIANDFINNSLHRTCDMCKKYQDNLLEVKSSTENTSYKSDWSEVEAKATLDEYQKFIEGMMSGHERLQIDYEVVKLHVRNLGIAFENLQEKYSKAKHTINGLQRNERLLLAQLSKYETMFALISDANHQYQEKEKQKQKELEEKLCESISSKIKSRKISQGTKCDQ